eukprot:4787069-Prymnesium_polylepis.1
MNQTRACPRAVTCKFVLPSCALDAVPHRTWGGIGNMLPVYSDAARSAFARNCSVRFNESTAFQLQQHLLVPHLIPSPRDPARCAVRALASRTSDNVAHLVAQVHDTLRTTEPWPGMRRDEVNDSPHCCRTPQRVLIGLHIRTFWADWRKLAQRHSCPAPSEGQRRSAADRVHSLFLPPDFDGRSPVAHPVPTLRTLLDETLKLVKARFGSRIEVALFVASDSPGTRDFAVSYARDRLGVKAAQTTGEVYHNNLHRWAEGDEAARALAAASVTIADLVLLSQADFL